MRNSLLEVTPVIPPSLARLSELAGNLFFSWHRPTRALFEDLDPELWKQSGGNPRVMLRCVEQSKLERCARDESWLGRYNQEVRTLTLSHSPAAVRTGSTGRSRGSRSRYSACWLPSLSTVWVK